MTNPVEKVESGIVELQIMPDKYQITDGHLLEYFTASPDSIFWCGPNRPHPFSWLNTSVICCQRTDFQIGLLSTDGDMISSGDFVDVEPATYRVTIEENDHPEPGINEIVFRHAGEVVDTLRIQLKEPQ